MAESTTNLVSGVRMQTTNVALHRGELIIQLALTSLFDYVTEVLDVTFSYACKKSIRFIN